MWFAGEHRATLEAYKRAMAVDPTNALVNALYCRGLFEIGELLPTSAGKKQLALYE